MFRHALLRLTAIAAAIAPTFAQTPELFVARPGVVDAQAAASPSIVRGLPVVLDLDLLYKSSVGDVVRFSAFDTERFDLVLREREEIAAIPGAFHWHADVIGQPQAQCTITVVGMSVTAYLVPGDLRPSTFAIQPAPGMHCLRELRTVERCACQLPGGLPEAHVEHGGNRTSSTLDSVCNDNPNYLTVLCVYDNHARDAAGGVSQIESILLNGLSQTSTVMVNSGATVQLSATSVRHVDYSANEDMSTTLDRLAHDNDGYMDDVHTWRRQEMADLVTLAVGDRLAFGATGGIAKLPVTTGHLESPVNGFSVCRYNLITDYVLAHEIGHNFGCFHDDNNASGTPYRPYAYGYANRFRSLPIEWLLTVMSYDPLCLCQLVKARIYSNPFVTVQTSVGTLACGDGTHNNAQLIQDTRQYIANYGLRVTSLYEPPVITREPQDRSVCPGAQTNPVMMSVVATNAGSYQWMRFEPVSGFVDMPGQTGPDLILPNVSSADLDRPYACKVYGPCEGWVPSRIAFLSTAACGATFTLGNSAFRWGLPFEALGDYDGDGYEDFAVSDLEYGANNGGTVWIVSGQNLAVLESAEGSFALERFGQDMAGLDGKLIVSGPEKDSGLGPEGEIVEIFHNSSGGLSRRLLLRGRDLGLNGIGRRLAVSNYIDGDGARDLVFMAPDPVSGANTLIVACSANAGSPYREHWRYTAPFGVGALECVGDMNGDGHDDVALGMASYNNSQGRVEILSGRDGSLLNARDGNSQSQFGFAIQGLGDLDGDGRSEIAVAAPEEAGLGRVVVMSLDMQIRWQRSGTLAGDRYGFGISSTGDGNGDGVHDVLVSRFPTTAQVGAIELLSGVDGSVIRTVTGTTNDYGRAVLSTDLTGDGQVEDIVMEPMIGTVYVYAPAPVTGPVARTDYGSICAGSAGNLARSTLAVPPRIGGSLVWQLTAAPPTTIGVLQLGFQGLNLPLDGLGAPGCTAQVLSFISAQMQTDANGTAAFAASVPNDTIFVGGSMLAQWVVLDLAANSLGITTSNASSFVIGGN